jgi:hypothetical protein
MAMRVSTKSTAAESTAESTPSEATTTTEAATSAKPTKPGTTAKGEARREASRGKQVREIDPPLVVVLTQVVSSSFLRIREDTVRLDNELELLLVTALEEQRL